MVKKNRKKSRMEGKSGGCTCCCMAYCGFLLLESAHLSVHMFLLTGMTGIQVPRIPGSRGGSAHFLTTRLPPDSHPTLPVMEFDLLILRNGVVPDLTLVICVVLLGRVGGMDSGYVNVRSSASLWLWVISYLWRVCMIVLVRNWRGPCGALIQPVTLLGDSDGVQGNWTSAGVSGVHHRY